MRVYLVAKESNLNSIKGYLLPKYKELIVEGTNNPLEAVDIVSKRHAIQPYDLMLFTINFTEQDLASNKELSRLLNRACTYAIKNLPVYILVLEKNKESLSSLRKSLTGNNVRFYPYRELNTEVIEGVMKEVLSHSERREEDQSVVADILVEKGMKLTDAGKESIMRIYGKKVEASNTDYTSLNRVSKIIQKFSSESTGQHTINPKSTNASIIENIKSQIFVELPTTPIGANPQTNIKIKDVNSQEVDNVLALENIKSTLLESNQDFVDYYNYFETLQEVIAQVKASDEPNKHEMVIQLMHEKASANEEMSKLTSEFVSLLSKDITQTITEGYTNDLKEFGDFLNVDKMISEQLGDIQGLKKLRNDMKDNIHVMNNQLALATTSVNNALSAVGNSYLLSFNAINEEMNNYANEHNVVIPSNLLLTTNRNVTDQLMIVYDDIKNSVGFLMDSAKGAIKELVSIIELDDQIIDKQDEVIDTLMTQKTVKTIVVDNVLQSKLHAIVGPDGVGKTQIGVGLAHTFAKYGKTLLIDLNLANPNLRFYNTLTERNESNWQNAQTIHMEDFIRIPIGKTMYQQLPFDKNLTVIQPRDVLNLDDYERVINPGVFSLHLIDFLDKLSLFYDRIVVILPQDLSQYADLLPKVGILYTVTDSDVSNTQKLKSILQLNSVLEDSPIKVFILNKLSRGIPVSESTLMGMCGISEREFKVFTLPSITDSIESKFKGDFEFDSSSIMGRKFNDLYKL